MNLSKSYQELMSCCNYRVLVMDGGFGAVAGQMDLAESDYRGKMFADHFVDLKGDNEVLCLTAPQKLRDVHLANLDAGADLIRANTSGATSFGQAKYRLQHMAYDMAKAGAQVACSAVKEFNDLRRVQGKMIEPKFVVGCIGPASSNDGRPESFGELAEAYGDQVRGLLDGGADVLLVESVRDALNCKAALYSISKECEKRGELFPIMVSGVFAGENRSMQTGQTVKAFWHSVSSFPIFSIGIEGRLDIDDVAPLLRELNDAFVRVSASLGTESAKDNGYSPEKMMELARRYADESLVNIVDCRGTSPETLKFLAKILAKGTLRKVPSRRYSLLLSGLAPMEIGFENCFVDIATSSPQGDRIIEVNLDGEIADPGDETPRFLNGLLQDKAKARYPVMIRSDRWDVLLAGMESTQGKGIVNSISLSKGEDLFLARAGEIRRHGFAVVCKAEDEDGLALTYERRVELIERMYRLLVGRLDFLPEDILFDPNVVPIGTGRDRFPNSAKDFFETCRYIGENLPHAHVVGDLSYLGYAFRESPFIQNSMQTVFLYHVGVAGLDAGIEKIPMELRHLIGDLLFNRYPEATDALLEYAEAACRGKGETTGNVLFLPRLEKRFTALKQKLEAKRAELGSDGRQFPFAAKIVLASTDSVVHDIDKDILVELLSSYGVPVTDLGSGCSCEKIMNSVICGQPDLIYLSAQFTPGIFEMLRVVREFKKQEIGIPLILGGGAVSDGLVAARIAPGALGPVVYVSDVRKFVKVAEALVDDSKRPAFLEALKAHQKKVAGEFGPVARP